MPANSSGWFWHSLARETGMIGHLFSPGAQRGPWPWMPYALDNGAFSCWDQKYNQFDTERYDATVFPEWLRLLSWSEANNQKPIWAIVPDIIGNWDATRERYEKLAHHLGGIAPAIAIQDGAKPEDLYHLKPEPRMICIGGSTEWKWQSIEGWVSYYPTKIHVLRVNAPTQLQRLHDLGVRSCDGTGWNRGDRKMTEGLELFCRANGAPTRELLHPYTCRAVRKGTGQGVLI